MFIYYNRSRLVTSNGFHFFINWSCKTKTDNLKIELQWNSETLGESFLSEIQKELSIEEEKNFENILITDCINEAKEKLYQVINNLEKTKQDFDFEFID